MIGTREMNKLRSQQQQAILLHALRDWLPEHVVKHAEYVHHERIMERDCHKIIVTFANGQKSRPLHIEETGRSIVDPFRVLDSNEYFSEWQAYTCMAAGAKAA